MTKERTKVGHVKALFRYPVKSMGGEGITATRLTWHGLENDRRRALVVAGDGSGFPWLTARLWPEIALYQSCLLSAQDSGEPVVHVRTPSGVELPIDSTELIEEIGSRSGRTCYFLHHFGGVFDCADVSAITTTTLKGLSDLMGADLDMRRFRPNLVIDTLDDKPFPEDRWVGNMLIFGDSGELARVRVHRKDQRCMVVNVDPDTGKQTPGILKAIVASRKNLAGVYGATERPGMLRVGDSVWLAKQ